MDRVLLDPRDEEPAEGEVDDDEPGDVIVPVREVKEPKASAGALDIVISEPGRVEERAEPVQLDVLPVERVVVLLEKELGVHSAAVFL